MGVTGVRSGASRHTYQQHTAVKIQQDKLCKSTDWPTAVVLAMLAVSSSHFFLS